MYLISPKSEVRNQRGIPDVIFFYHGLHGFKNTEFTDLKLEIRNRADNKAPIANGASFRELGAANPKSEIRNPKSNTSGSNLLNFAKKNGY
jgi:hypothetical protein